MNTDANPEEENTATEETQAPVSMKDQFHSKIKGMSPDNELDEEGIYGKAMEHVGGLEKYQETNRAINKQIAEVLTSYPELAKVIKGIVDGMTFREALSRYCDIEGLTPMEGDPDEDALKTAREERMKSMGDEDAYRQELDENIEMSQKEIVAFAEENNMAPEEVQNLINDIDAVVSDIHKGKISKDFLAKWRKALNYDGDVSNAAEMAAIDAKNQKIEMRNATKETKSDGLPAMSSGTEVRPTPNPVKKSDEMFINATTPPKRKMIA